MNQVRESASASPHTFPLVRVRRTGSHPLIRWSDTIAYRQPAPQSSSRMTAFGLDYRALVPLDRGDPRIAPHEDDAMQSRCMSSAIRQPGWHVNEP